MALTSSDLAEIVGLRQVLRTGIEDPSTLVELNRFESQVRLTFNDLRDQRRRTALEPEGKGARLLLSTLIAITWTAVGNGTWLQLKSCENQECRWVIFDHSRNATLRWCSDSACGSRERARRYRARQLRTP